jgi:hypothetical protein
MFQLKIQEVHGDINKSEITDLDLEGCDATTLEGLTEDFDSLSTLSLANNKLNTLKAFPTLKTLTTLNLKGNSLESGLDHLTHCDLLKVLDLSDNKFSTVEQLEPLKSCSALEHLHVSGCPIASTEGYRAVIFEALPQLSFIDGTARGHSTAHAEGENGTHKNGDHKAVNGEGDGVANEAGVDQLLRDDLEDDDEEYCPEGEEEEDDEIDEDEDDDNEDEEGDYEEDDTAEPRGVKRKHEDEDPVAQADDNSANGTQ